MISSSGGKLLLKLFILFYLFFVSFSSLNATEITFSVSDYWKQGTDSSNNDKVTYTYLSDPMAYTIGLKDWESGILGKYRSKYLKKFSLNYTLEYTYANAEYKGAAEKTSVGYFKTRYANEKYEIYASRQLNNNLKIFIGYAFSRLSMYNGERVTSTGVATGTAGNDYTKFWYHPVGFIWNINPKWIVKSQYNHFRKGHGHDEGGVHLEYDVAWGVDVNIGRKLTEKISLYTFYSTWDVDDSDVTSGSWYYKYVTEEIGAGISYKF